MDYPRITQQVYGEPWAVLETTHQSIQHALQDHQRGQEVKALYQQRNHFNALALALAPPKSMRSRVYRRGQLAYVPVRGVIGKHLSMMETMCGGYNIDQLEQDVGEVMTDNSVVNVLFDWDSPGGQVTGVPEAARLIKDISADGKRHTYSFSATICGSAAYWLAAQSDYLYTTQTAMWGGVGVYIYRLDTTEQLKQQGKTPILIKAGKHKGAGMPGNPLSEEEKQMLQDQVDLLYGMMTKSIIAAHPEISIDSLQGQCFLGPQALEAHLVTARAQSLETLVGQLS